MPSMLAVLGLNAGPFKGGLADASRYAQGVGGRMASYLGGNIKGALAGMVGGLSFGAIVAEAIKAGGRIQDLSDQFRVSTDTIQKWDVAASKVGMSAEDMGNAFMRLKKNREDALEKGDVGGFGQFGINMETLRDASVSTEEIMNRMVSTMAGHPITNAEDAASMELMGKSGSKILAAFTELQNLGPINLISAKDVAALDKAEEKIAEMKRDLTVGGAQVTAGIGGWLQNIIQGAAGQFMAAKEFLSGRMSYDEARYLAYGQVPPGQEAKPPPAGATASKEPQIAEYNIVKTVDLHKDDLKIQQAQAALDEKKFKNAERLLSVEQRRAVLRAAAIQAEREAVGLEFGVGDELGAIKAKSKAEDLRNELAQLDAKAAETGKGFRPDVNALQKIGAYSQGPELAMLDVQRASGETLRSMDAKLAAILAKQTPAGAVEF